MAARPGFSPLCIATYLNGNITVTKDEPKYNVTAGKQGTSLIIVIIHQAGVPN